MANTYRLALSVRIYVCVCVSHCLHICMCSMFCVFTVYQAFCGKYHFCSICKLEQNEYAKHFKWITRIFRFFTYSTVHESAKKWCVCECMCVNLYCSRQKRHWEHFKRIKLHEQRIFHMTAYWKYSYTQTRMLKAYMKLLYWFTYSI